MSPVPVNDSALVVAESPTLDTESMCRIMTVHKATFLKLSQNRHGTEQLADFFQDIASTYSRMADALRCEVRR